jgi:hypothetical protein
MLIRRLGGRAKIPRGSELDKKLRGAIDDAFFCGACAERAAALERLWKLRDSMFFDSEKATVQKARVAVMSESVLGLLK